MKQKFNVITSTCVPLPLENVDTDQIIPARFLKATTREEKYFGDNLFRDWRSSLQARTSVPVPLANMRLGLLQAMASVWLSALFLPISTRTTNSTTSYFL